MTNQEMIARGLGTVVNPTGTTLAQKTSASEQPTFSQVLGNILSTTASGLSSAYNGYVNAQIGAANAANSASAYAQQQQYEYNKQLMDLQNTKQDEYFQRMMDFNANSAAKANAFTEKMWQKAADYNTSMFDAEKSFNEAMLDKQISANESMWKKAADYNSAEAAAQRAWQEEMSNTAYQRAIKDMKAAGINPILAAMNGGANIGSGATASIGSPSVGSTTASSKSMGAMSGAQASTGGASAAGGSVGNYTGQGYHISDSMAMFGAVIGTLGQALTGLQSMNFFGKGGAVQNTIDKVSNTIMDAANSVESLVDDVRNIPNKVTEHVQLSKNLYDAMWHNNPWKVYNEAMKGHSGGGGGHNFDPDYYTFMHHGHKFY